MHLTADDCRLVMLLIETSQLDEDKEAAWELHDRIQRERKVMATKYLVGNLWLIFCSDCNIISRIPVLRHWAFGVFVRSYLETKQPFKGAGE